MEQVKPFDWAMLTLLVTGGINWGIVGWFKWNLIEAILGPGTGVTRLIYLLMGFAGLYMAITVWINTAPSDKRKDKLALG